MMEDDHYYDDMCSMVPNRWLELGRSIAVDVCFKYTEEGGSRAVDFKKTIFMARLAHVALDRHCGGFFSL